MQQWYAVWIAASIPDEVLDRLVAAMPHVARSLANDEETAVTAATLADLDRMGIGIGLGRHEITEEEVGQIQDVNRLSRWLGD